MSIAVTKVKCHLVPWSIWDIHVQCSFDFADAWHSSLAGSSLSQLLVPSWSADEHWCDESEMSSGAMEHLGDQCNRARDDGVDGL
ncbi:unnamed protein product [Didymodactylos carnosus]|uniref:Uncharacterized protein n=1 Tax=Didymodactylos carnosus TaxID=1234261 RepID=A0A8S2EZA0_9BILA|nr:unnamed protein product [Didymodactylos carnosus]CAF4084527.1 unnamed protein product [Didymodactylos carnosus]